MKENISFLFVGIKKVMIYSGVPREEWASSGIAILVRKDWKNRIIDYKWISQRTVQLGLKILTYTVTINGIYAPAEGKPTETEEFYDELQAAVDKNNKQDYLILAGDFNARVGTQPVDKQIGSEGEQTVNNNG
jgi:exonuclease III